MSAVGRLYLKHCQLLKQVSMFHLKKKNDDIGRRLFHRHTLSYYGIKTGIFYIVVLGLGLSLGFRLARVHKLLA